MKCKKFLALITLSALAVSTGLVTAADPLVTDVAVKVSVNGTSEVSSQSSMIEQTVEGADKGYLVNIKSDDVAYAQLSWGNDEETNITIAPEGLEKEKFFAVADNREVTVSAEKLGQTEVHKVKFNYVPHATTYTNQATVAVNKVFTLDLNELFSDKDGDTLTFSYVINDNKTRTMVEGNQFSYTPTTLGTDNIVFYAEDAGSAADSSISSATFRMTVNVQNDARMSSLSFSYPSIDSVSLSPKFDAEVDQYVLNIPDDIPYVVPNYASGEAEKCYINGINNVNSISTEQPSFVITYIEGVLAKDYTFTFNHLPKYVGEDTIHVESGGSVTIPLESLFADTDGDELNVTASTVADAKIEEGNWIFTPTEGNQVDEVTFTANDGKGTTTQKVTINTIAMDSAMLKSLSMELSNAEDGTYEAKPFTTTFLPNQYSYVFEISGTTSYGKVQLEKANEDTLLTIRLQRGNGSTSAVDIDTPFEIPVRDNATLTITLTDNTAEPAITKTYTILFNRPPAFETSFPDSIDGIATGQELSLQYEALVYDIETTRAPTLAAYDVATGNELGTIGTDEDEKKVWLYTPVADGTVNVRFVITDLSGSTAEKTVPITAVTDTEPPVWSTDRVVVRTTSSTTIEVSWPRPTDNDVDINGAGNIPNIKSYTVYYKRQYSAIAGSVVVAAGKNVERKTTIRGLTEGAYYDVYVTAEDRSGNVSANSSSTRVTMPSTSGGSTGGSSTGSNTGSSTGTTYVPSTTTPDTSTTTNSTGEFADMTAEYAWAQTAVTELAKAGIVNGTGNGMFSPGNEVTRADFLVMLFRALGIQNEVTDNFDDVPIGSYYYQTVGMAKAMGVATGVGDNLFYPEQSITREEMITLTYRILEQLGKLSVQSEGQTFGDIAQVSEYAVQPVLSLSANGIIAGDENGNVNPKANTQRSEAAVMIYRIWSK